MSKLSDECYRIYVKGGQYAVYDFITANYPEQTWSLCEPCESESPIDTDYACLVCGSPTKETEDN